MTHKNRRQRRLQTENKTKMLAYAGAFFVLRNFEKLQNKRMMASLLLLILLFGVHFSAPFFGISFHL